jgi:hypothetical protein
MKNPDVFSSIRKNGDVVRIGIANHFFDRNDEKYLGMDIHTFQNLLDDSITYNPQYDELPKGLTKKCYNNIMNKNDIYGKTHCFKLIESEDIVVCLNYTPNDSSKPKYWNEWVIVSVWRCDMGITIPTPKEWIKVNGRYIYL